MFFPAGATAPSLRLEITPTDLDAGSQKAVLDLGSSTITYAHGPSPGMTVAWPAQGSSSARLEIDPAAGGSPVVFEASGPWALFRLIAQGSLQRNGSSDRYTLVFQRGGHRAVFLLRANSVVNPFASPALQDFRCPSL
jgi:type VI secretion system protein ImpL